MKPKEIQEILDFIAKSGLEEVSIETEELKISTKRSVQAGAIYNATPQTVSVSNSQPLNQVPTVIPTSTAKEETPKAIEASVENHRIIKSPMIGTFYRSPGPNEEPFINIGDSINIGTTVCIIEAMKLFNEIESEFSGKLIKILAPDATPVEYDQPLFLVDVS